MKTKNELCWNSIKNVYKTGDYCKLPVKVVFLDKTTIWGWFDSLKVIGKSIGAFLETMCWWDKYQYNLQMSYLTDLETIAKWFIDNAHRMNHDKKFRQRWISFESDVKETLVMINIIKNNFQTENTVKTYEFPTISHLSHFAYMACQTISLGYYFRELEKDFPISFKRFKQIQNDSKLLFDAAAEMKVASKNVKEKETDKWLM